MQNHQRALGKARSQKRSRQRGAVMVEYAFLLTAVVVPAALALIWGGHLIYQQFLISRMSILAASP